MSDPNERDLTQKLEENLTYNINRWGSREQWENLDAFGYNWGSDNSTPSYHRARRISEQMLLPLLDGKREIPILEIAPGAGRFTTELIRLASELHVVDLNQACIDICKERFKYYTNIQYHKNDGVSVQMVPDNAFDLIASFDSFVHIAPEIIRQYIIQFVSKLRAGGIIWLHHSNGYKEVGHRTEMTSEMMKDFAKEAGLDLVTQHYLSQGIDCISVLTKS